MILQKNKLFYSKDINNHHTKFHKHDLLKKEKGFKDCKVDLEQNHGYDN